MKARVEIVRQAIDAERPPTAPFWGTAVLGASLGAWALIIAAARFLAGF